TPCIAGCHRPEQGPPGPQGPISFEAYTYLFLNSDQEYNVPNSSGAGVVEFSANPIANSTTGTFIFLREDSPFHSAFITGVQVPVEGDYSIDFYTEGGIRGEGFPIFAIAVGGTFVPSGDNLTFGTVTGSTTVSGGSFSSADTRNVPTIGTA